MRKVLSILWFAALLAAVSLPSSAAEAGDFLADPGIAGNKIFWTLGGDANHVVLRVALPSGEVVAREFEGADPVFEADLPGTYNWELTRVVSPSLSKAVAASRLAGQIQATQKGSLLSGTFSVRADGFIVAPFLESSSSGDRGLASTAAPLTNVSAADQVILDDLIVDGSACIGQDCANGESFGFDTLRLKENNLRIKFDDTSNTGSFPSNDWQITANDSANGGANKFSIDDITGGRTPMTIEASAPSHSLYVDDGGRLGLGTSTPVVDVHVKSGNTPTVRLEQDGSSGFTPQTWDLAGNETNFFVRDASNGSRLPFRIEPSTPSNTLYLEDTGDVGIGTTSPDATLNVEGSGGTTQLLVHELSATNANRTVLALKNNGITTMTMEDTATSTLWNIVGREAAFRVSLNGSGVNELNLATNGDLTVTGIVAANAGANTLPDYVFEADYPLMSLPELAAFVEKEKHLPNIPSADDVAGQGGVINMTEMQLKLLEKVEELTLYTIAQEETIQALQAQMAALQEVLKTAQE